MKKKDSEKPFRRVTKHNRQDKLTDEVIEVICNHLRLGHYIETAAIMAGIRKQTFYNWIKRANDGEKKYIPLLDAVNKAMGEAETRDLLVIDKCANGRPAKFLRDENGELVRNENGTPFVEERGMEPNWSAAAWRLERRYPKKWARTEKIEQTGKDGGPQVIVTLPSNGREVMPAKKDDDGDESID